MQNIHKDIVHHYPIVVQRKYSVPNTMCSDSHFFLKPARIAHDPHLTEVKPPFLALVIRLNNKHALPLSAFAPYLQTKADKILSLT